MPSCEFALEADLVEFALPQLPGLLRLPASTLRIDTEVGVGRRVADVVALVTTGSVYYSPSHALNLTESLILASLRQHGPTRIDLLEQRCGLQRKGFRNGALNRLRNAGLIQLTAGGRIEAGSDWRKDSSIIAIEAKLTRWRQALAQAIDHTRFADRSFVLLPESQATPAQRSLAKFSDAGIGLLIASSKGLILVLESAHHPGHCWRREFIYSRLARTQPTME